MERKCKNCAYFEEYHETAGSCRCGDYVNKEDSCDRHAWSGEAIKQAFSIVREAVLADEDIRRGFLASIESEITESKFLIAHPKESIHKFAERILQRIVGWKE